MKWITCKKVGKDQLQKKKCAFICKIFFYYISILDRILVFFWRDRPTTNWECPSVKAKKITIKKFPLVLAGYAGGSRLARRLGSTVLLSVPQGKVSV